MADEPVVSERGLLTAPDEGRITLHGSLGAAVHEPHHAPVYVGDPDLGKQFHRLLHEMVDLARTDERSARQLFNLCAVPQRVRSDFERARRTMIELEVPAQFLPDEEEIDLALEHAIERARLYGRPGEVPPGEPLTVTVVALPPGQGAW